MGREVLVAGLNRLAETVHTWQRDARARGVDVEVHNQLHARKPAWRLTIHLPFPGAAPLCATIAQSIDPIRDDDLALCVECADLPGRFEHALGSSPRRSEVRRLLALFC